MRYFFTFLILLAFSAGCRKEDAAVVPLDAPVSSVTDLPTTYQLFDGGIAVAGRLKSETHAGQHSGEWRYNQYGQLLEWRHYQFGELTVADQYRYDAAGYLRFVQHFDNKCSYSSSSSCSGPLEWTSYDELTNDPARRVTQRRTYLNLSGQWSLRSISAYEYDNQNQLITIRRYDDRQVITQTQTLTYDGRGNVVAMREQNPMASSEYADRTFRYEYDAGRNPYYDTVYIVSAFFLSRNVPLTPGVTYEYRSDGLPIRIRQNGTMTELMYY